MVFTAAGLAVTARIWNCLPASPLLPMKVCEVQLPAGLMTAAWGWGLRWLLPGFWVNTQIFWPARRLRAVPCTRTAWGTVAGGVGRPGTVICTCAGPLGGDGGAGPPCLMTGTWSWSRAPAGMLGRPG